MHLLSAFISDLLALASLKGDLKIFLNVSTRWNIINYQRRSPNLQIKISAFYYGV